jgi:hypothetical protein
MKKGITLLALSALAFVFGSCASDDSAPGDSTKLLITPDTVFLSRADSSGAMNFKLSCGCGFTLKIVSTSGNHADIIESYLDTLFVTSSEHAMGFHYYPSATPAGTEEIVYEFEATKHSSTYKGTSVVRMTN